MRFHLEKTAISLTVCLLLLFVGNTVSGQRTVSGRITDGEDVQPVPGASVFIANTSAGTLTDADGQYRLTIPGEGSYRLTVSHVGYQLETVDDYVRIYPDGTYSNPLMLTPCYDSGSLQGLNAILPLDYIPDDQVNETSFVADNKAIAPESRDELTQLEITDRFVQQLDVYPQEKIHLHTDRDVYVPGEKIWFKAYVVDAQTHLYPTYSQYVYVELISPADTLVHRVMVKQTDEIFYGNLPITEAIPEGDYTLRAYTRFMENMGDDYFFKKNIRIGNIKGIAGQSHNETLSLTDNTDQQDFDVSFFPEGGNLSEGVVCRVAFKALNHNGTAASVTGTLIDQQGVEISAAESFYAGMGAFSYIPEAGKRYYFQSRNANGLEKRFELPQPKPATFSLNAYMRGDKWVISLQKSASAADKQLYILAHCRGTVLYFAEWNGQQGGITFQKDQLPAGIIQFLLFDSQMNPLSERLIFSKNKISEKVVFQTDKSVYEKREKIIATIKPPSNGVDEEDPSPSPSERVGVRCSISITDDRDIPVDESVTILSSLLLSSELKGYIENPAYYLLDTKESETALELLMMTHGWRRYNVPEVVKNQVETPQIPFQMAQEISGRVKALLSKRSVPDSEISIFTPGAFWQTKADGAGVFSFQDVEFPDSTSFYIQALNKKGSDNVELVMNKDSFPLPVYAPQSPFSDPPATKIVTTESPSENDFFIQKASQRANYDDDMRLINLTEIEVIARKINKKDTMKEPRLQFWANESSDETITRNEFRKYGNSDMTTKQFLSNYYGGKSFDDFAVYVDGRASYDPKELELINLSEIETIDVFLYASSMIFGAQQTVSITTRRGGGVTSNIEKYNYVVHNPLGYQKPVEFYSPKYETLESKQSTTPDLRTTIFWKPDVVISPENSEVDFEFYTSDYPSTYSVVIEGITSDGRIVRQVEKIRVEQ